MWASDAQWLGVLTHDFSCGLHATCPSADGAFLEHRPCLPAKALCLICLNVAHKRSCRSTLETTTSVLHFDDQVILQMECTNRILFVSRLAD